MGKRLLWIVLTGTPMAFFPVVAYADEVGDLVPWSQFFARTDNKVEEYHFALKAPVTFEGDSDNHSIVPHLEGSTLTYAIEDTSSWPDSYELNETVMNIAENVWGEDKLVLVEVPKSEAMVVIEYGGTHESGNTVYASTLIMWVNRDNGAVVPSGNKPTPNKITLYDPFFEAGDPGLFGIGRCPSRCSTPASILLQERATDTPTVLNGWC